jgi:small subunit ribosomal protein S8
MSMTDPIADMLTRIRNACGSKHRRVDMPVSKMKTEIARILKENNYIQDYQTLATDEGRQILRVRLKYAGGQSVILGMAIVSTNKGLMSDREARQARTGGELVAVIW